MKTKKEKSDITDPEILRRIKEKEEKDRKKSLEKAQKKLKQQSQVEKISNQNQKQNIDQPEIKGILKNQQPQQVQIQILKQMKNSYNKSDQESPLKGNLNSQIFQTNYRGSQEDDSNKKIQIFDRQSNIPIRRTQTMIQNLQDYEDLNFNNVNQFQQQYKIDQNFFKLGFQFKNEQTNGKNRCILMLEASKQMINDLNLNQNQQNTLKHLQEQLKEKLDQIQQFFNKLGIVLEEGMKQSIKLVYKIIEQLEEDSSNDIDQYKLQIKQQIDDFIQNKIYNSQQEIIKIGDELIKDGDVILTFARSKLMSRLFINSATKTTKQFKVIIVDNPPYFEGRQMADELQSKGIQVIYTLLGSLSKFLPKTSKVMVGGASMLVNGTLVARVGTALIANMANSYRVPFICCCETYKFSNKSQLDSFADNQLRNPRKIIASICQDDQNVINAINLKWDLTPSNFIQMVITELGKVSSASVPVILKQFEKYYERKYIIN